MENTQNIKFSKVMGKWVVTGPADIIIEKATVLVNKADGTTTSVYIRHASTLGAPAGTAIGYFTDAAEHEAQIAADAAQAAMIAGFANAADYAAHIAAERDEYAVRAAAAAAKYAVLAAAREASKTA